MELDQSKLKSLHGYQEGASDAVDNTTANLAIEYKKTVTRQYICIYQDQIDTRLGGDVYHVTRKYDGELNVLFFDGQQTLLLNRSGKVRKGLPCAEEAGKALVAAGVTQAIIPAELYVDENKGRSRIFDVLAALADEKTIGTLRLAVFDLVQLNGEVFKPTSYADTYQKLKDLFANNPLCAPVRYQKVTTHKEVKQLYAEWTETEGGEGLVVRVDGPMIYKIKPRHSIDVAVVGFSEGTGDQKGQVRSLLLAMMPVDGQYQIIGKTGNGMSDEFKQELLERLKPLIMESTYIETDSNHVAFHMLRPSMVIELKVTDVLFETSTGSIMNPVLEIIDGQYRRVSNVPGVSFVFPIFERIRDDKTTDFSDIRLNQIDAFAYYQISESEQKKHVAEPSFMLFRSVYKKVSGAKLMVQKFAVWKTNKDNLGYPSFVMHYTNFSSDRKEPLQREVLASNDENQMKELLDSYLTDNIKKGWVEVSTMRESLAGW